MRLFGGAKPDHPFADAKEARRIIDALPLNDPVKALEELTHWTDNVSAVEGFRPDLLHRLLFMIDDAAQSRLRKLERDYFAASRPSRFQEIRIWTAVHGYRNQAGLACGRAVEQFAQKSRGADAVKELLPTLLVRTLRGLAQQLKWMHVRYGPIDPTCWARFNSVYALAEDRQLAQSKVAAYPGVAGDSTPQLEYLKGIMFSVSAPDGLLPSESEMAERLISILAPRFTIAGILTTETAFWIDICQAMPPARMSRMPKPGPGIRGIGVGSALSQLDDQAKRLETGGTVPPEIDVSGHSEPSDALDVMRHLQMYWSPQAPERKAHRHPVNSRLWIRHGYDGVIAVLGADDSRASDNQNMESWIIENVSAGGFGAVVPQPKGDWLRVGELLALQPEGGSNWLLGSVCRVNRTTGQQARVGIQTLAKSPETYSFTLSGTNSVSEQGVLLKNGDTTEARIVLRPGVFAPMQNLERAQGDRHYVYLPQAIASRGEDYEIARFRELVRDS